MPLARHCLLTFATLLVAGLVGCAQFDHSPQTLSRGLAIEPTANRTTVATGASRERVIVRAQSPDDYPRQPMPPSGTTQVAQQPLYNPPPAGAYTPIAPPAGVPQTTTQPPPAGAYGGPIVAPNPNYTYQPGPYAPQPNAGGGVAVPGLPANGQPYPLPSDGSAIPGFPDMAPSILGDRPAPPPNITPLDVYVGETRTGKLMFGVGVNSDAGMTGQVTIDERNFDLFNPPNSWDDFLNGTAWRGRGQGFRVEAQPGTQLQRYLVSFTEPYLFDTPITMSLSAFYFERAYFDYMEKRVGGRMAYGYRLTPDLSLTAALRAEDVVVSNPRVAGVPELDAVLGSTDLYTGRVTLVHDTRDNTFLATQGHYLELGLEQGFGEFSYPRADVDYRQFFTVRERADGSGRHILAFNSRVGFSGSDTPMFERYFAGGYSTMRGFAFRGATPTTNTVRVGGTFQWLNSVEYFFPLTADEMVRGTVFCDFGTVEKNIAINNFRVSPGFGFLFSIPALGPAPLAINFAFPVAYAPTDQKQVFSFYFGLTR
jgi:outer membrane protein insertion porin family